MIGQGGAARTGETVGQKEIIIRRILLPQAESNRKSLSIALQTWHVEELRHCLGAISPEHREPLMLRFFEGMSYEEIARATGASVGTVRS